MSNGRKYRRNKNNDPLKNYTFSQAPREFREETQIRFRGQMKSLLPPEIWGVAEETSKILNISPFDAALAALSFLGQAAAQKFSIDVGGVNPDFDFTSMASSKKDFDKAMEYLRTSMGAK